MNSCTSVAAKTLNEIVHKMGHFLSLAASLTLWFGIYSTVSFGTPDTPLSAESATSEYSQHVLSKASSLNTQHLTRVAAEGDVEVTLLADHEVYAATP